MVQRTADETQLRTQGGGPLDDQTPGELWLVTPDCIMHSPEVRALISSMSTIIGRITFDECHIYRDHQSFRPALGGAVEFLRATLPHTPRTSMTATLTTRDAGDILPFLGFPPQYVSHVDAPPRTDIHLSVLDVPRADELPRVQEFVRRFASDRGQVTIWYIENKQILLQQFRCLRRAMPDKSIEFIVGGHNRDTTSRIVQDFQSGGIDVILATSSFAVGIDHPNVALVVMSECIRSKAGVLQQMGRAARSAATVGHCYVFRNKKAQTFAEKMGCIVGHQGDMHRLAEVNEWLFEPLG
jgi:superfamily II DNA helicase RecQ